MIRNEELVFFRPKQWSKRFGSCFFTIRFNGFEYNNSGKFYEFQIEVEFGGDTGALHVINKRYTDFCNFRKELEVEGLLDEEFIPFPQKGWWWNNSDEKFLKQREVGLREWLYRQLDDKKTIHLKCTQKFLELEK